MAILAEIKKFLGLPSKQPELISVVVHFRNNLSLTDETLHSAITRAWDRDVNTDLREHVVNTPPICFVKFEEMMLMLSNVNKPYCPPQYLEQALAEFQELRQKEVVREHKAFLAIDLLSPKDGVKKDQKRRYYRRICSLAAEFVDDNCLGVYLPECGHMRPYDSAILSDLRNGDPVEGLRRVGKPSIR